MADWQDDYGDLHPKTGLVASFFVMVIILFFAGLIFSQPPPPPPPAEAQALPATAVAALSTVFLTHTPTAGPSPTLKPTATPTFTPTPTPTPTLPPPQAGPLPTPGSVFSWTLKVPILMYHYISVPPENADIYRQDLSVTPENFRAQMQYLADNGFTPIDLYDLSRAITNKTELPPRPVIITLDDGYRDNYTNGFPILKEFGFKATIFLATGFLDDGHPGYLTWDMVREMSAAGIRFEPHSKTHSDLRDRNHDFLVWEILGSQETIAAHIGYMPRYFCYPSGRYDEKAIQVLEELEFWGAVTTMDGTWHGFNDRFEWKRVRLHDYTTLADFADLVDPGNTVGGRRQP